MIEKYLEDIVDKEGNLFYKFSNVKNKEELDYLISNLDYSQNFEISGSFIKLKGKYELIKNIETQIFRNENESLEYWGLDKKQELLNLENNDKYTFLLNPYYDEPIDCLELCENKKMNLILNEPIIFIPKYFNDELVENNEIQIISSAEEYKYSNGEDIVEYLY